MSKQTTRERFKDRLSKRTITENIDYRYLLMQQYNAIADVIMSASYSPFIVNQAIWTLYHEIPDGWKDKVFNEEVEKAIKITKVDIRPFFCGVRVGKLKTKNVETTDYFKLLTTCTNLFDRLGLLMKTTPKSIVVGRYEKSRAG